MWDQWDLLMHTGIVETRLSATPMGETAVPLTDMRKVRAGSLALEGLMLTHLLDIKVEMSSRQLSV